MQLYFASAEQPLYLRQLIDFGVKNICISFYEWQRRHSTDALYKHIPADMNVLVTPGIAKKEALDFEEFGKNYIEFCERNADQVLIYDFDAPACPLPIRRQVRNQLSLLPNLVAFPVDQDELDILVKEHERVGINARLSKAMAPNELRRLPATLYGSNITDPRALRLARFEATTSMAWLSGRRYGELWVFARNKLHHYSSDNLAKAVRVHARDIEAFDVDPKACAANDRDALTEIAVRSLQAMADSLALRPRDRQGAEIAGASGKGATAEVGASGGLVPVALLHPNGAMPPTDREMTVLPVISMKSQEEDQIVQSADQSLRQCDNCYLSTVCPEYVEANACAYSMPVEIKTQAQREAAEQAILEMQFQRVAFGVMAEQMEGTGLSPRVGQEIDRFFKTSESIKELSTPIIAGNNVLGKFFEGIQLGSGDGEAAGEEDDEGIEDGEVVDGGGDDDFDAYEVVNEDA